MNTIIQSFDPNDQENRPIRQKKSLSGATDCVALPNQSPRQGPRQERSSLVDQKGRLTKFFGLILASFLSVGTGSLPASDNTRPLPYPLLFSSANYLLDFQGQETIAMGFHRGFENRVKTTKGLFDVYKPRGDLIVAINAETRTAYFITPSSSYRTKYDRDNRGIERRIVVPLSISRPKEEISLNKKMGAGILDSGENQTFYKFSIPFPLGSASPTGAYYLSIAEMDYFRFGYLEGSPKAVPDFRSLQNDQNTRGVVENSRKDVYHSVVLESDDTGRPHSTEIKDLVALVLEECAITLMEKFDPGPPPSWGRQIWKILAGDLDYLMMTFQNPVDRVWVHGKPDGTILIKPLEHFPENRILAAYHEMREHDRLWNRRKILFPLAWLRSKFPSRSPDTLPAGKK